MSLDYALATVVGTDNVSPVHNPNARWQIWNMNEIYLGATADGKYVPKIGDVVMEILGDTITNYIVVGINEVTLVPIFREQDISRLTEQLSENDILFGVGPGTQADTYRVYLDKSVNPYRLTVDARLRVAGSNCHLAKIFKGADVSENGIVISGIYNAQGVIVSENVPLELAAFDTIENHAIKVVAVCNTTFDLADGEVVTAVFYDTAGFVVSKRQLLVENTGFIRSTDASRKYVVGISLETPFLSTQVGRQINYPLNVPLNALNLIGVVEYSDGSKVRMAVDGTRFSVSGLDAYAATIIGQKAKIVLKYKLALNEIAYGVYTGSENHISEIYDIITSEANGNYAVQLFAYPVWVDPVSGYRLEWFLYDLDRSISYNVTPNVVINGSVSAFDPKLYGVKQTISVTVNLRSVNGSYKNFNHVQFLDIILNKSGTSRPDFDAVPNWEVASVSGQVPTYGTDVHATFIRQAANLFKVKVMGAMNTLEGWLDKVYKPTNPLVDTYSESQAPTPTHFQVIVGNNTVQEHTIDEWNVEMTMNQNVANDGTLFIKFIKRTTDGDLQLAAAGLSLFQVDNAGNYIGT